jgi:hypothetical protein
VLRWLSRLFRQRIEAENVTVAAPPFEPPPAAVIEPTKSDALMVVEPVEAPMVVELPTAGADAEAKETCPTCGRASGSVPIARFATSSSSAPPPPLSKRRQ